MERRFVLFLVLSFAILFGYSAVVQRLTPKPRPVADNEADDKAAAEKDKPGDKNKPADKGKAADKDKAAPKDVPPKDHRPQLNAAADKPGPKVVEKPGADAAKAQPPEFPEQFMTLGNVDPAAPDRMMAMLTTKGAALVRVELSSDSYRDIDDRSGYLGHLFIVPDAPGKACQVQIVGPGTPAAEAGLQPGDVITAVGNTPVADQESLERFLKKTTKPGKTITLHILRNGKQQTLEAKLRRRPLEVIRPEAEDPLRRTSLRPEAEDPLMPTSLCPPSMLLTLQQLDDQRLSDKEKEERAKWEADDKVREKGTEAEELQLRNDRSLTSLRRELDGLKLRTANWQVVPTGDKNVVQFLYPLSDKIDVVKTYRLVEVPQGSLKDSNYPAYHLEFEIEIRNNGTEPHRIAYRLDGPNGLPTEGDWYSTRVTRSGGSGLRDFVISMGGQTPGMVGAMAIADGRKLPAPWPDESLTYIGVDAQYFSAVLMPLRGEDRSAWFDELMPICVGKVNTKHPTLTNTSCRLVSLAKQLKPGEAISHKFKLFAGPKKPSILEPYALDELVYFGWPIFSMVARPLTMILHGFYGIVGNYGIAILMLTILVRGCMFPLSLKQAAGAMKMQMIQPEMKKLQEKHKNDPAARAKAQQELFKQHNYNPVSGCLPIFIQMPVFMGLYRSLMVAIELRNAPLLSHSIQWCSNLAAPDMLFNWTGFLKTIHADVLIEGAAFLPALGPYFNILPIVAIVLMIVQMKIFTPPPADEQAAVTQKTMTWMMGLMGILFFKVASGLCIYFIVSSLWGLVERRFLPKTSRPAAAGYPGSAGGTGVETRADAKARARIASKKK